MYLILGEQVMVNFSRVYLLQKQHELETTSKYMFINDGYMQKQNQVKRNNLKVSHQHQTPTVITYSQLLMVKTQV